MKTMKINKCWLVGMLIFLSPLMGAAQTNVQHSVSDEKTENISSCSPYVHVFDSIPHHYLYAKSNAVGWGMIIMNIACEYDLSHKLSINLPFYYSPFNYFSIKTKFRTFSVQPELRYWIQPDRKFYVGVHVNFGTFNFATNGHYRYQDHGGHSPLIGGGFSAGYRTLISNNRKWNIEFTLGCGYAYAHYDRFYNVYNGKLVDTHYKNFFGIDNAAVSFTYRIDFKDKDK
jgi:hypothetical protein